MKLKRFKVTTFRNIRDSGWIEVDDITSFVGQNEAGKSNLFEALYRINPFSPGEAYNIDEDWPVDDWGNKDPDACVCQAEFALDPEEIESLTDEAGLQSSDFAQTGEQAANMALAEEDEAALKFPLELSLLGSRSYIAEPAFAVEDRLSHDFDAAKVDAWAKKHLPQFLLIQEYGLSGTQIELNRLGDRLKTVSWDQLNNEEQTIKIVLDLARLNIDDLLSKGNSAEGRTARSFDLRAASAYLSRQFQDLWTQKKVHFHIEIDGTTLNIFAEDEALGMPVRLHRRSNGFRWHVSFAWEFTHASQGRYKGCILLLEEPGIHLHHCGQHDLLGVFHRLSKSNTIL